MKRFFVIAMLAVLLPLNLLSAANVKPMAIEKYDGSQDPEEWFFDNVLDENGELFLDDYIIYIRYDFEKAIDDIIEKRLGCVKTNEVMRSTVGTSDSLAHYFSTLSTRPPLKFKLYDENRYLAFWACQHGFCSAESYYVFDTVEREIAATIIFPADIFGKEKDEVGDLLSDFDNYYIKTFVSDKASKGFIQKSIELTQNLNHPTNRKIETYAIDCRN